MFCTKHYFGTINKMHDRFLHLIQQNYTSDSVILLEDADKKTIHQKCIELLMIEFYKYLNSPSSKGDQPYQF